MMRTRITVMTLALASAAQPAMAQRALDRADPTAHTAERVTNPPTAAQPAVPVEVVTKQPAVTAGTGGVMIGAVTLTGLTALTPADFADVIEPYLGKPATPGDLAALANAVATRARARGYVFTTASVAPQRLANGVLTVAVDEGRIDAVRLAGPDEPAVRAALQPLVTGRPATLGEVEHRLLIAGDVDGVYIRSSRWVREGGEGVLIVTAERTAVAGRVALRNDGSRPLGPVQLSAQLNVAGLLASDDVLSLSYVGTPVAPRELNYGRVRYAKRVSPAGTELALSASASRAHPGAYLAPYDIESRSWFAGVSVLQPLVRQRAHSLWLTGEFGIRDLDQDRADDPVRRDRLAVGRVGVYGFTALAGGRLRAGATLSRGVGLFGATREGDPLASRDDADGFFTTLGSWAEWTGPVIDRVSVRAAVETQLAGQPLLVSEEIGLGGTGYLRAYDWSERSGDEGAMGLVELRYDLARPLGLRSAQVYAFADGGRVTNLRNGYGGGGLASAGGGLRTDIVRGLGASVEVAVPLSGVRYDSGTTRPRLNFGLAKSF